MASLPSTLLSRLSEDSAALTPLSLPSDLPSATRQVREYAQRKLLTLTPAALTRLGDLLDSSDEKISLGAITKVLEKSPATQAEATSLAAESLPPAAIEALAAALASFASAASAHLAASAATPIAAEVLTTEESPDAL